MPVKVMKDANSKSGISSSESFAQGIIYATKMGASIINLSLGWPRSLETPHLRNAVAFAIEQGVILVAAAGNNNSSEPLFPCAYVNVICAGASTLDGTFAGFTNYGGHVDAVAPGEGILSLNPTAFIPSFFSVTGYDIKSGTSQSAPLLAGMISLIKAQNPELKVDDVLARLYGAAQNNDKKKYILGGTATIASLSKAVSTPIVRPVLKLVRQVVVVGETAATKLTIPFKNFGLDSSALSIKVKSMSPGIQFADEEVTLESMKNGEIKNLTFPITVTNFEAESSVQIKVTITGPEGELSFLNDVPVVRNVTVEESYKKNTFVFQGESKGLGGVVDGKIIPVIATVDTYGKTAAHQFYTRRLDVAKKTLTFTVYTRTGNTVTEAAKPIVIEKMFLEKQSEADTNPPSKYSLYNFIRMDLNLDGKDDYLVQTKNEEVTTTTVKNAKGEDEVVTTVGPSMLLSFFDSEMKPLWKSFPHARVILDTQVLNMANLNFTKINHPELGLMMIPTFLSEGQLPKVDQKQDFFQRWDVSKENRLYYLEPLVSELKFRIRALTSNSWKESLKKQIGAFWYDTVIVENILPVSVVDAKKGVVRVILSVGQGTMRKLFIATFDSTSFVLGQTLPQIVLQTEGVDSLFSVTPAGLDVVGDTFMNIYDRSRGKIVTTKNDQQTSQTTYAHVSETDILAGHIATFENAGKQLSIIQTRDELISLSSANGKVTRSSRPKLRYSFLSSQVLSELYNPVIYKRSGAQAPALYVDSTAVTMNRVYLFEEQGGKLVSSIRNSLIVPPNCKAINPAFSQATGNHEFVFLCIEGKEWTIRTYEMK